MAKVKICGLTDPASFDAAMAADWVGFVFFPRSPRYLTPEQAATLSARHHGGPPRVGLFVKPTAEAIAATLSVVHLDILQIYADNAADLEQRLGLPVWQAIGVATAADLPLTAETTGLVIEAKPPKGADRPGGNATSFDWTILRNWRAPRPWILAGGLNPGNVAAAIATSGATAVDTSSGVEISPGQKDPRLIARFIAAARQGKRDIGIKYGIE